ncbi:hypothetical protein CL618_00395 [archaeon]|nr:hypothetical protein [archaeon]|tara:strand:+ start:1165 stop:1554 length:390 start_codon:yes stop_codon:yes gene_type:complete
MLFKKKEKPEMDYAKRLSYEEAIEYFKVFGINIDELGFPNSEDRKADHISSKYIVWFEDLETHPSRNNGNIEIFSKGLYLTKPCGTTIVETRWLPGEDTRYEFEIRNGKLKYNIKQQQKTLIQRILDKI